MMAEQHFAIKMFFRHFTGGRPMICDGHAFIDIVSGKPVYHFIDLFGRHWLAEHRWAFFRVENEHGK